MYTITMIYRSSREKFSNIFIKPNNQKSEKERLDKLLLSNQMNENDLICTNIDDNYLAGNAVFTLVN